MTNSINRLGIPVPPSIPGQPGAVPSTETAEPLAFQKLLFESLAQTESMQQTAQSALEKGLAGGDITQVEIMTSMKKADLALRMMIQVRNKIFDAYDEIKQLRM